MTRKQNAFLITAGLAMAVVGLAGLALGFFAQLFGSAMTFAGTVLLIRGVVSNLAKKSA